MGKNQVHFGIGPSNFVISTQTKLRHMQCHCGVGSYICLLYQTHPEKTRGNPLPNRTVSALGIAPDPADGATGRPRTPMSGHPVHLGASVGAQRALAPVRRAGHRPPRPATARPGGTPPAARRLRDASAGASRQESRNCKPLVPFLPMHISRPDHHAAVLSATSQKKPLF